MPEHDFEEREQDLAGSLGEDLKPEPESPPKVDTETPAKEEPAEKPTEDKPATPEKTGEPQELSDADVKAELKKMFGTETPEAALKRASDQTKTVGKQGAEAAEARTEIAGLKGQIETLTALVTQKASPEGEAPEGGVSEAPDPVLEPAKFAAWVKGLTTAAARTVTPGVVESEVAKANAPRDEAAFQSAVASHETQMERKYGAVWGAMAGARDELANSMDNGFAKTGQISKGKMSPVEGYQLMAMGKSYLAHLKAGRIRFVTTGKGETPKGGMGVGAGSGEAPVEPGAMTMEQIAAAEVASWG